MLCVYKVTSWLMNLLLSRPLTALQPGPDPARPQGYRNFMQQLLDYIAILAFVVVYFLTRDIFLATAVLMAGVTL